MEVQAVTILQAVKLNMTQYLTIEDSRIARLDTGLRKLRVPRVSLTREDDQGVTTQRLEDQLGDVDGRSQPRVLGSLESGGFSKVENGGVGDAGFVELLKPVDYAHLQAGPGAVVSAWSRRETQSKAVDSLAHKRRGRPSSTLVCSPRVCNRRDRHEQREVEQHRPIEC